MLPQPHATTPSHAASTESAAARWALCPNCERLLPADAPECPHCSAAFGDPSGWQLQPLPGRVPSPAERAALATAADRRASHAQALRAHQARQARRAPPGEPESLAEQVLRTTGCLLLERSDTAAQADASLAMALCASVVLLVPALLTSGMVTLVLCGLIALLFAGALTGRENTLQRSVTLDMANAVVTVDMHWPHQGRSMHRIVPTRELGLQLQRGVPSCDDPTDRPWLLDLVLPPDSEDPGSARIQLASLPAAATLAAQALHAAVAEHLGVQADGQAPQ